MDVSKNNVDEVCTNGISDYDDVMLLAEYIDDPDTVHDRTFTLAYELIEQFVSDSINPNHPLHPVFLDTCWRSYNIQRIKNKIAEYNT